MPLSTVICSARPCVHIRPGCLFQAANGQFGSCQVFVASKVLTAEVVLLKPWWREVGACVHQCSRLDYRNNLVQYWVSDALLSWCSCYTDCLECSSECRDSNHDVWLHYLSTRSTSLASDLTACCLQVGTADDLQVFAVRRPASLSDVFLFSRSSAAGSETLVMPRTLIYHSALITAV